MQAAKPKIEDLPPSAKLVFKVLEYDGPLTQKNLVDESMLSARTVRYAIDRLDEVDAIEEQVYIHDARQSLYSVRDEAMTDGGRDAGSD